MFTTCLLVFVAGAICGMMGMYFYFEATYIDELDAPVTHTITIEIDEGETHGKNNTNFDGAR